MSQVILWLWRGVSTRSVPPDRVVPVSLLSISGCPCTMSVVSTSSLYTKIFVTKIEPVHEDEPIPIRRGGVCKILMSKTPNVFCQTWTYGTDDDEIVVAARVLTMRRNVQPKLVNTGVAASKSSTGNKPQSTSVNGTGNLVQQINYYGCDYSSGHAGATTQMDPAAFTKPVADIMTGPALKSPNVEEAGYSDRIQQLTMGNSTITTQEAANAIVAYGVWPEFEQCLGEAVDKSSIPGPAVDRFYTLESQNWTTSYNGTCYRLPGCLNDLGMFGQNVRYHYLMRSGFLIHVQANATKFHQGMLMVVAIPECEFVNADITGMDDVYTIGNDWKAQYPVHQLTLFPHQFINLRTNTSATLVLPYLNSSPMENAASHNYWTVAIIPVGPLQYTSGASTTIPITVSIAPMSCQFNGLRAPTTAVPQGIMTAHVPGSGQFITTVHNSGFPVYPEFESTHGLHIPGRIVNLLEAARVDTMVNFGTVQVTKLALQLQTSAAAGSLIFSWRLDLSEDWCATTYLARLAKFFVNYRGSMKLTFTYTGAALQTGKILLCYTPPGGAAPTTRTDAMLGTHLVWDIGLQSSATLVIPWISQTQYRYTEHDSKMCMAGYITAWYQTALVTGPGMNTSGHIVGFLSASDDFQFRIPTDNAYYQGLAEETGKTLKQTPNHSESVTHMQPEGRNVEAVTSGVSGALSAVETGATSGAEAEIVMETRASVVGFSGMASDVANFMSKYALLQESFHETFIHSETGQLRGSGVLVPLSLQDLQVTAALRTKWQMFTYVRFNLDVILQVEVHGFANQPEENEMTQPGQPFQFQALYCPPGLTPPPLQLIAAEPSDPRWFMPTTPTVYFTNHDPPASIRIPFVGVANSYCIFYDGYSNFDENAAEYGKFPGNGLGQLAIRPLWHPATSKSGAIRWALRVFAKPMQIETYCPRPIVKQAQAASRAVVMNVMPRKKQQPRWVYKRSYELPVVETGLGLMHLIPLTKDVAVCPYHWLIATETSLNVIYVDVPHDLAFVEYNSTIQMEICDCGGGVATTCRALFNQTIAKSDCQRQNLIMTNNEEQGDHFQVDVLKCKGMIPEGWCGSPLFCCHGKVTGMATASGLGHSYYTELAKSKKVCELVGLPYMTLVQRVFKALDFLNVPNTSKGWFQQVATDLGKAFGDGFTQKVASQVEGVVNGFKDPTSAIVRRCISFLVKAICACVLIARSENKAETAACVGVMLGIDIITLDPFDWLAGKLTDALGIKIDKTTPMLSSAEKQGPQFIEWVKDFNACATAAKSLEWLGDKIQQFIDWLKKLFQKESQSKQEYSKLLGMLPHLRSSLQKMKANRGRYHDQAVKKCINLAVKLDTLASHHGTDGNVLLAREIQNCLRMALELEKTFTGKRVEPVAICIHGQPGTGKSLATMALARMVSIYYQSDVYCLPPDPKHFDNYRQQAVVVMDDVCQNPDGEDLKHFCQMVSTANYYPPMADLSDKGIEFTSKFVFCTTNAQVLTPPTISEPDALDRRFFLDLDIEVQRKYTLSGGRLDAKLALQACPHDATAFKKCCPMICGSAIMFKDRRDPTQKYTLDAVLAKLLLEREKRESTGDLLEALFQGPVNESICEDASDCGIAFHHDAIRVDPPEMWLMSDCDAEGLGDTLLTIQEQVQRGVNHSRPCPAEIADLLRAVPTPEVIKYCEDQGWIENAPCLKQMVDTSRRDLIDSIAKWLTITSAIVTIASTIYLLYRLFASSQGNYEGKGKAQKKAPEVRVVKQGPSCEFAMSINKKSLFEVGTTTGLFTGLGVKTNWMLLPRHAEPGETVTLNGVEFKVLRDVVLNAKEGELELRLVQIDRPVNFPDITNKFLDKMMNVDDCYLSVNSGTFKGMVCPVGSVRKWGTLVLSGERTERTAMYSYPTKHGQCGGVVVTCGKIVAMHVGGDGKRGYGTFLLSSYFKNLDGAEAQGHIVQMRENSTPIHHSKKTKLQPSVWHDIVEGSKEPAALSEKDPRLEVDLVSAAFSKYAQNEPEIEMTEHMKEAIDYTAEKLRSVLGDCTKPLTLEEAAYGIPNLEGLDLNTSAGYPYVLKGIKKRDILDKETRDVTKLQACMDMYGVDLPFITYMKDELRPLEKVKLGKTRLIEASSMNDTIRMKMTFGTFFAAMHENCGPAVGSAVGCNPDVDWTRFRVEMDGEIVAFDYSNFDASLNKVWFECLKEVMRKLGFEDVRPIDHIVKSRHLWLNKDYTVEGGMPSGTSGTSIFNSLINCIIIRTLCLDVYKNIDLEDLKILAYGDDVIVTYPYELDPQLLANRGKIYGLKMTPPDKGKDFKKMTWDDVTFLKRGFRPAKHYSFLIHPTFDMKEIYESLRWTRNAANTQEHVRSLCELAWHNGRKAYEQFCDTVRKTNVGRACILPPYRSLKRMWLDSF